jgi:hypothetical protein
VPRKKIYNENIPVMNKRNVHVVVEIVSIVPQNFLRSFDASSMCGGRLL